MTTKKQTQNFAFIDSQNLNLAIKEQGWNLDFKKFRIFLKDKFRVSQAFIFIGHVSGNERLYTSLQKYGYIVIHKPTLKQKNGEIKGNCDAELVLHAMIEYENYDKAIIVSGDGDFHCLAEYLEEQGKLERLVIPNKNKYSSLLRKFASKNKLYFLSAKKNELEREKK